ncbi:MAG: hypothetical protein AB7K68_07900 [Bacteriovoracia bacterium]
MIVKFLVLSNLLAISAFSANLTPAEIRERLEVRADVYQMDASGKRVVAGPLRTNYWRFSPEETVLEGDWSSNFNNAVLALRHRIEVTNTGTIKFSLEEFEKIYEKVPGAKGPTLKESLGKKEMELDGLEAIVWKVKNPKSPGMVVRYFLNLKETSEPISMNELPVAATGVSIADTDGYLWADEVDMHGKYTGITTHRGTLLLSYVPFAGAKEMGIVEKNEMRLTVSKKFKITLRAKTDFLPATLSAKVYALYRADKRTKAPNSVSSFDSNKEENILEQLK